MEILFIKHLDITYDGTDRLGNLKVCFHLLAQNFTNSDFHSIFTISDFHFKQDFSEVFFKYSGKTIQIKSGF